MKTTSIKNQLRRGFSLVEMLIVIAVIGIIAAIAIPNISNLTDVADKSKLNRNAQTIVSTYAAGKAAGVVWSGDLATFLSQIDDGQKPATGPLKDKVFQVPGAKGQATALEKHIVSDGSGGWKYVEQP